MSGPVLRETDPRVVEDLERILAPERVLTRPIDRLGRSADARASYARALELARQEPERRFLQRRLREVTGPTGTPSSDQE